ncbi:LysR family transcriptional regulator [Streptomyces acidiscabies]|uniref:LysR family transcriptional regulator n=1 Tax=Streptomyces acidiscabies TaxID=42234 RepID=A0AAP6BGL7_9ACTN|nr:LysR family transcriptional regulator [Streptomyces acidiscabies]MBP5937441.1 LysR family transcriptional regulator [Streptomyces sp. LBUM 1476]MBZ3914484.1 LysR family transcriptional regulator [Streptomyces acidiscabies]MDX2964351.1 LysR family transcriptional regulator [Streptomyces acidiscabies]MDX3017172.1 LysR family transcriptional regulator [Streptomyces acidiscabies]MDX3789123.1 LysR family transcriptional regulator [Streptomyces acidiscabies]
MRVTQSVDLNLLVALDVLLEERSVQGAARRLHLSEPAMSRTLGRIRTALGDPVLVRAGRRMVPTPRALAVRAEVSTVVERARAVFTPADTDLRTVVRTFSILGHDAIAAAHGPALLARAAAEAPGIRLRFLSESHLDAPFLREGTADLEVGVVDSTSPEVRTELLAEDRMVGVVRAGHPLLEGELTPERFAVEADHLTVSRRGKLHGPVDAALAELGLQRRVVVSVGSLPASLFVLRDTDLVGLNTGWGLSLARTLGLVHFEVPLPLPPLRLGMAWHPRYDADPAHAWLRGLVREWMRGALPN